MTQDIWWTIVYYLGLNDLCHFTATVFENAVEIICIEPTLHWARYDVICSEKVIKESD